MNNIVSTPERSNDCGVFQQNDNIGIIERKNFMMQEFKEPMEKRVQFAVELRKKKT